MNMLTITENTQRILALREKSKEEPKEKTLNVPTRTYPCWESNERVGRRNRTMLTHDCWFFKKPEFNSLTVQECIDKYPKNFIWAYENLSINWSEHIVKLIKQRYPWAVRKGKDPYFRY